MNGLKPTRWQRLIASNVLPKCWIYLLVPVATLAVSLTSIGSLSFASNDLWATGLVLLVTVLSLLVGFWIGIITVWFVFGPILYHQGFLNGGPFQAGDVVQVISGPHRDQIGRIDSAWQHETWRVDLGEEARENYSDIFADYQLLRVTTESAGGCQHSP
jgi:hypothetical protein